MVKSYVNHAAEGKNPNVHLSVEENGSTCRNKLPDFINSGILHTIEEPIACGAPQILYQ